MILGKLFLQLSLKSQIYFALVLLSFLSFSLMFFFLIILSTEIISQNKLDRKKYFYDLQHKNIESSILFQNFCILQYDQLIKSINSQVYYLGKTFGHIYITMGSTGSECIEYDSSIYKEELEKNENENYVKLYYYVYGDIMDRMIFQYFLPLLETSVLLTTKTFKSIRIPFYGNNIQLLSGYMFYLNYYDAFFSVYIEDMKSVMDDVGVDNLAQFILDKIYNQKDKYKGYFDKYLNKELEFFKNIKTYPIYVFENYSNKTYIEENFYNSIERYIEDMSYNFMFLDYSNSKLYLINQACKERNTVNTENKFINNYFDFIYSLLGRNEELDFIPLFNENNTLISVNLCFIFLIKQMIYIDMNFSTNQEDRDKFNEILDEIRATLEKGKSTINDCFLTNYNNYFEKKFGDKYNDNKKNNIKEVLLYNFENYYDINFTESHMFFQNSKTKYGKYYFGAKSKFPDCVSTLNFDIPYFLLNQTNLYFFKNYFPSYKYWKRSVDILDKCFMVTILFLLYIWIIFSVVLFCIAGKIIAEIIKPISRLQDLIDGSFTPSKDNKEENINYNIDENINNLYILIKNLLSNTKFDVQKFGKNNENKSENTASSKNYNNNLIVNDKLINQNQNLKIEEENAINNCIFIYRDYTSNNKSHRYKKNMTKIDCNKNKDIGEDKNKLYRELMKIVECIEKPLKKESKDFNKTTKTIKSNDLRNSLVINEKDNKKYLYKNKKNIKIKKNILYHWYLEAKNNIENKYLDTDREISLFCKTIYNFS